MQLKVRERFEAPASRVVERLASQTYIDDVCGRTDVIERGEVVEHTTDGNVVTTSIEWTAPTRLPRVLSRYEGRAPAEVSWVETTRWTTTTWHATLSVSPDVPESWKTRYSSHGSIQLVERADGTELVQEFEFKLHVPVLGPAIEKLLQREVEKLLRLRLDVLRDEL